MVTFIDGPAAGQVLALKRSPLLLRVVFNHRKKEPWDALDQSGDTADRNEQIFLYQLTEPPTQLHLLMSPRSRSGWYAMASYRLLPHRHWPTDETLRDKKKWIGWCEENQEVLTPQWAVDHLEKKHEGFRREGKTG